jgi:hypothetical protein
MPTGPLRQLWRTAESSRSFYHDDVGLLSPVKIGHVSITLPYKATLPGPITVFHTLQIILLCQDFIPIDDTILAIGELNKILSI